MQDVNIIGVVKDMRKLITTLDAFGPPIKQIIDDNSGLNDIELYERVVRLSDDIHKYLQKIEQSEQYKKAVKKLTKKELKNGREYMG